MSVATNTHISQHGEGTFQIPFIDDAAMIDNEHYVSRLHEGPVMAHDDRRRPPFQLFPFEEPDHGVDRPQIDPRIRFVIDSQFRIPRDSCRKFNLLYFPPDSLASTGKSRKE